MVDIIVILAAIGFLLSTYAYIVRRKTLKKPKYKPLCDINQKISCSVVLTHQKASLVGISNSLVGMILYLLIFISAFKGLIDIIFYLSLIATLASIYLSHLLAHEIKRWCLVCVSSYVINVALLIVSFLRL